MQNQIKDLMCKYDWVLKIIILNFVIIRKSAFDQINRWRWLDSKRVDDNVEDGLWRIHDTLYDLTDFVEKHPGGRSWLEMTKGHDITEAFMTHHIRTEKVAPFLKKYRIRETKQPRNVKLTFDEKGFYMTLKRKVAAKLPEIEKSTQVWSKVCHLKGKNRFSQ